VLLPHGIEFESRDSVRFLLSSSGLFRLSQFVPQLARVFLDLRLQVLQLTATINGGYILCISEGGHFCLQLFNELCILLLLLFGSCQFAHMSFPLKLKGLHLL
jgi:hypothetical protein